MYIERCFTRQDPLQPITWFASAITPLFDNNGSLLAYCEKPEGRELTELPEEIFHHRMKQIDPDDIEQMISFMSDYGILGASTYSGSDLISRRPQKRWSILNALLDVHDLQDACAIEKRYRLYESVSDKPNAYRRPDDEMLKWYLDLQSALKDAGYQKKAAGDLNPGGITDLILVTPNEAKRAFEELRLAGSLAQALAVSDNEQEIARLVGEESLNAVSDQLRTSDDYINSCLRPYSPKLGFRRTDDPSKNISPCAPSSLDDEFSRAYYEGEEGCLEEAIAIQIYNFALNGSEARRCEHCGEVFVNKYSPERKGSARSTSDYCSDKCQKAAKAKRARERAKQKDIADLKEIFDIKN